MSLYLDRVLGQDRAKSNLIKLIESKRLPHALLFSGPNGVGKHFTSIQFIKEINSIDSELSSSIKKKIANLEEPLVKFIFALPRGKSETASDSPTSKLQQNVIDSINSELNKKKLNPYHQISVDKAQNIKISSIRELKRFLSLDYHDVKYRVVIIHEAHLMSVDAQNAILKSLEEPPDDVIIIMHSSQPNQLLPTIKSRCQEIFFDPLEPAIVSKTISEFYDFPGDLIDLASKFSDGSITRAIYLLENDIRNLLEKSIDILRYSLAKKFNTAYTYFDSISDEMGEEGLSITFELIIKWLSDVTKDRFNYAHEYYKDYSDTIKKFNEKYADKNLMPVINKIYSIIESKGQNFNLNICTSNIIFEIGRIGIG